MKLIFAFFMTLSGLFFSQSATSVTLSGNNYYEVCLPAYNSCVVGVITKFGQFAALFRDGNEPPGVRLGDVFKVGKYGELIAGIREEDYQQLVAAGLERIEVDVNNIQSEIDKVQSEIDGSISRCLVQTGLCAGGGLLALGSSGLTVALAGLACFSAYQTCQDLDRANVSLFAKRKELKEKLLKEAEEKTGEKIGSGGGGGGGGAPSTGGQGGWFVPGGSVGGGGGGSVSASESAPGGGPSRPIILQ